jgi:hypothetical protein
MVERNYEAEQKVLGMLEKIIATLNNILKIHKDFSKKLEVEEAKCLYCSSLCALYGTGKCENENA